MYWEKEIETLDRTGLEALQLKRLITTLNQAGHSPYYGRAFRELGIDPDGLKSLADVPKTADDNQRRPSGPMALRFSGRFQR